jgi:dephospho-CoA kinase
MFAAVWCVGASRVAQMKRLQARGLSDTEAAQRVGSQLPVAEKMVRASIAFWAEGTTANLMLQLDRVCSS